MKITFAFSNDSRTFFFTNFIKVKLNYKSNLQLYLQIHVCEYDPEAVWNQGKLLFVKEFDFEVKTIRLLKQITNFIHSTGVEEFFKKFFPESTLLKTLEEKGLRYLSQEPVKPVYFDCFMGTCEFLEVEEDTSFCGNFKHDGKEGCAMIHRYCNYRKKYMVYLTGNDNDSWTKYFDTEKEMLQEVERLRRIAPISKNGDMQGYEFTN